MLESPRQLHGDYFLFKNNLALTTLTIYFLSWCDLKSLSLNLRFFSLCLSQLQVIFIMYQITRVTLKLVTDKDQIRTAKVFEAYSVSFFPPTNNILHHLATVYSMTFSTTRKILILTGNAE